VATVTERLTIALSDRYRIERELGQGGMATVYLAHDLKHDRRVALKVLHPELAAVLGEERFLLEIKTTAHLQHPNILQLFDSGSADGLLYYVMPFVEGESLRGRLSREMQLPIDDAITIARGVAGALDYAHRRGVIHRDIKPENILLHGYPRDGAAPPVRGWQPMVADFGIALAVSQAGGSRLTQTGLSPGTPQYMSPEQATGERTIDGRTDLYSLGAVTYEMLVGEPPHSGSTSQAIIARVLTEKPRAIRTSRPNVPLHLARAVERALEKLPADRFASAGEFAAALEDGVSAATAAADTSGAIAHSTTAAVWSGRARAMAPWAAAAVLAVVAALGWLRPGATDSRTPSARFPLVLPESAQLREDLTGANVALSPDGTRLVYVGGLPEPRLFIRDLNVLEPRAIPGTERALSPRFSPDGRWVSFTTGGQLKKVPLSGGPTVTMADGVARYSWGDRDVLVFARGGGGGLYRVSASGGPVQPVTTLDTRREAAHSWPELLPGSSAAVFTINADSVGVGVPVSAPELAAVRLDHGVIVRLGVYGTNPRYVPTGHLLFGQDDGSVAAVPFDARRLRVTGPVVRVLEGVLVKAGGATEIAVAPNGTLAYVEVTGSQLALVDRSGVARPLLTGPGRYTSPRLSPDGDRIAFGIRETGGTNDVWVYTSSSATLTRLTSDGRSTSQSWTPDGRRIAWLFTNDRRRQIRWQSWDGGGAAETLVGPENDFRGAAFSSRVPIFASANAKGLWITEAERPSESRLVVNLPRREQLQPEISPDGRWLAYRSAESGRNEVYVTSVTNGGRHQVSTNGGSEPAWSPDGRALFYRAGGRFIAVAISTQPTFVVRRRDTLFRDLYLQGVERTNYDITGDGRQLLLVGRGEHQQRAVLVFGWLDELRERMRQAAGN